MDGSSASHADHGIEVPLAHDGRRWRVRLGAVLTLLGVAAFLLAVLTGGTKIAGVEVAPGVGAAGGVATAAIGALVLYWSRAAGGNGCAIWAEDDVLCLHAHAGPVLRVRARDITRVSPVRPSASASLRMAYGDRVFTVQSRVPVSRGVDEVSVGARYVDGELEQVRENLLRWLSHWQ